MSTYAVISCDGGDPEYGCPGEWHPLALSSTPQVSRSLARRNGWHVVRTSNGTRDICPECWTEGYR